MLGDDGDGGSSGGDDHAAAAILFGLELSNKSFFSLT